MHRRHNATMGFPKPKSNNIRNNKKRQVPPLAFLFIIVSIYRLSIPLNTFNLQVESAHTNERHLQRPTAAFFKSNRITYIVVKKGKSPCLFCLPSSPLALRLCALFSFAPFVLVFFLRGNSTAKVSFLPIQFQHFGNLFLQHWVFLRQSHRQVLVRRRFTHAKGFCRLTHRATLFN